MARLTDASGALQPGLEVVNVLEMGGRRLVGLLPMKAFAEVTVDLGKPGFVWNLITQEDLGSTQTVKLTNVAAGEPLLFGVSTEPVTGLETRLASTPRRGETIQLEVQLKGRDSGEDMVHLSLIGPDGKSCPWMTGSRMLVNGTATIPLKIAANEAVGDYRLVVRDVLSGHASEHVFTLADGAKKTAEE